MRPYVIYIYFLLCASLIGCNDDKEPSFVPVVELQQNQITNISHQGGTYEVIMKTEADWTAVSSVDWCKVLTSKGNGDHTLVFKIEANLGDARQGEVAIYVQEEKFTISIQQNLKDASGAFKNQIPVIFHVIYNDASDKLQNPSTEKVHEMLEEVNKIYQNAGINTIDFNLEFVLAEYDPQGNKLKERGIERVYWPQKQLDPRDVMEDKTGKYMHFLWEPKDYVNILLYSFSESAILGISTFPYSPQEYPEHKLEGTGTAPMSTSLENLNYVHGISINSFYLNGVEDIFTQYVSDPELKELMDKQSKLYVTLAHELGHYFGLRHTFSEVQGDWLADTDYCTDTESYVRLGTNGYEAFLTNLLGRIKNDPSIAESFDWRSLFMRDGEAMFGEYEAHNVMDYSYCYLDQFTAQQRERVRFVLEYSPLIPGPKKTPTATTNNLSGVLNLPVKLSDGYPLTRHPEIK